MVACSLKVSGMVSFIDVVQPIQQAAQSIITVFLILFFDVVNILNNHFRGQYPDFEAKVGVSRKKIFF